MTPTMQVFDAGITVGCMIAGVSFAIGILTVEAMRKVWRKRFIVENKLEQKFQEWMKADKFRRLFV